MRRLALAVGAALLIAGTLPVAADAAYLRSFRVKDTGASIAWSISVCTSYRQTIRRFSARLEPEDLGVPFTRRWGGGVTGPGCDRWRMTAQDIWTEQVWDTRLTVIMANGQILRSPFRSFYIT